MSKLNDLFYLMVANNLPVVGVSGTGPRCRIDFTEDATEEDKLRAAEILAQFDWTPPGPVKDMEDLKNAFLSISDKPEERQAVWDAMIAGVLLWFAMNHPDDFQKLLDQIGLPFKMRK